MLRLFEVLHGERMRQAERGVGSALPVPTRGYAPGMVLTALPLCGTVAARACEEFTGQCGRMTGAPSGWSGLRSARQRFARPSGAGVFGKPLQWAILALASVCQWPVHAATEGQIDTGAAPKRHSSLHAAGSSLNDRIKTLSQALDLDAKQQAQLRKVLEDQREQVRKVWADTTAPAAYRIGKTQAIDNRTADQIRALLNDEQKKKYHPLRHPHETAAITAQPSVEDWMNAFNPK